MWCQGLRGLEFRFGVLGDVRWGECCGELLLGEWGRVMGCFWWYVGVWSMMEDVEDGLFSWILVKAEIRCIYNFSRVQA